MRKIDKRDLTGQRFGHWTVIERDTTRTKMRYWNCKCDCGSVKSVLERYLLEGRSASCGCSKHDWALKKYDDLLGARFGNLTVIGRGEWLTGSDGKRLRTWKCRCDCGNIKDIRASLLKGGHAKSCGCGQRNGHLQYDLSGCRFGRLTVIDRAPNVIHPSCHTEVRWKCLCDCGNETTVSASRLKSGAIQSCGCLVKETARKNFTTHGESQTRLYHIWSGIKRRCLKESCSGFRYYGGRGIAICDEWENSYESFRDWAVANGYNENLTIDRIDVNGNYSPDNCRWITQAEQMRNTRRVLAARERIEQ